MGMDIWRDIPHAPWSVRRANEQLGDHLDAQAKGMTRRINPERPGGETRQKVDGPHNPQRDEDGRDARREARRTEEWYR